MVRYCLEQNGGRLPFGVAQAAAEWIGYSSGPTQVVFFATCFTHFMFFLLPLIQD